MLTTDTRKINFGGKNTLKIHHLNLDTNLDALILISSKDEKLADLFYNKTVDVLLDRIHPKNVYKDFSNALENINGFLDNWKQGDKVKGLSAIIGIYHKKTFLFSTVGPASCYLYNLHGDIIEVTDKNDVPTDFGFISSGDVADGESLILSNIRLLDVLSKDDMKDGFGFNDIQKAGKNMEHILLREHTGKNVGVMSVERELEAYAESVGGDKVSYYFYRVFDNRMSKEILSTFYHLRDTVFSRSKYIKKIFLGLGVVLSTILLFWLVSGFFHLAGQGSDTQQAQEELLEAQQDVIRASENLNNPDLYSLNIEEAQNIINSLESQNLFLNDVGKLKADIAVLQKQFNGISPYEVTPDSTYITFDGPQNVVKLLSIGNKLYLVHTDAITGPILQGQTPQTHAFGQLAPGDSFIDATVVSTSIFLITKEGKVVKFSGNNFFSYQDVSDQPTWEHSPIISAFDANLYLLNEERDQIFRHKNLGNTYSAGTPYLREEDSKTIGKIYSIAIDGGIYILKDDGSLVKLFRTPEYRLEGIVLNNLPKNYDFNVQDGQGYPSIRARQDLKYIYMLVNHRILVFQPNSNRYQDVKSLQYIGQIEGDSIEIEDMFVENDGEIFAASETGIYKVIFDVVDDKLVVK